MGYSHHYDLIKEGADSKEDLQPTPSPVVTSWWKFILCNVLAALLGAGATYLVMRSSVVPEPAASTAVTVVTTTVSAAGLTVATPSVQKAAEKINDPDGIAGKILDCGGSPAEARAKGCVYDVMMQDWVPEPCYDAVLTERYLAMGNWTWYADGEGKTIISDEDMRKGEHGSAFMSASYHKEHCVFSWLKIVRALRNGKGISQELLSYDHVLHCAHGALKQKIDNEDISVSAPTNYAHCAIYETWKQDFIPDEHDSTAR